jgi:hypothetical protein
MAQKISGAKTSNAPRPQERERVAQLGDGRAALPYSFLDTRVLKKTDCFYYHCD